MLFSAQGKGFFCFTASCYGKGVIPLLLGLKSEEKLMRVAPWNQCPLVDRKTSPDLQLASTKNRVCGCASFACFRHTAAARSSPPLEVGPAQNQEVLPLPPEVSVERNDQNNITGHVDEGSDSIILNSKSALKKAAADNPPVPVVAASGGYNNCNEHASVCEKKNVACRTIRKKVQWTDKTGGELFEVREFEKSDAENEFDHWNEKTCTCRIM